MSRTRPSRIRHTPRPRRTALAAGVAALALAVTGCGSASGSTDPAAGKDARVSVNLRGKQAKAGERVEVTVPEGRLAEVTVRDREGGELSGRVAKDGRRWTSDRVAAPGTTYEVKAEDDRGRSATHTFTTEAAGRVNKLTLAPGKGTTVGVAHPLSIVFDNPVKNKKAVERHLKVTTSDSTEGSWGWITDYSGKDRVDWRPKEFWKPGTKVTLDADLNGVDSGDGGGWFVRDYATSFTVGRDQKVEVDLDSKQLTLLRDGSAVRRVPMSAGTPGGDKASWGGVNVLMSKEGTIRMNSETVGLGDAYDKMVDHSMRLTWSGMYAHAAPWNAAYFGNTNHSSGCVGMSDGDAGWLYEAAQVGDPFVTKGSGHKGDADVGNGYGLWNLSWSDWQAKSALND
ncbi:Ig-like domain-containing protein [Streptomyces sp. Da 82-17]|uniref:L,D-transpeptidase n=1 Tax=Streptomyces sp. Da 82-17 TaxID=3377116 RepID=UPI0038D43E7C